MAGRGGGQGSCSEGVEEWARARARRGNKRGRALARRPSHLLDAARQHVTHTLDLVGAGDGQAHWRVGLALGHLHKVVQRLQQRLDVDLGLVGSLDVHTLPPAWQTSLVGREEAGGFRGGGFGCASAGQGPVPNPWVQALGRLLASLAGSSARAHQVILSDFLIRLSPIQPEMGRMGTDFSTKSA